MLCRSKNESVHGVRLKYAAHASFSAFLCMALLDCMIGHTYEAWHYIGYPPSFPHFPLQPRHYTPAPAYFSPEPQAFSCPNPQAWDHRQELETGKQFIKSGSSWLGKASRFLPVLKRGSDSSVIFWEFFHLPFSLPLVFLVDCFVNGFNPCWIAFHRTKCTLLKLPLFHSELFL